MEAAFNAKKGQNISFDISAIAGSGDVLYEAKIQSLISSGQEPDLFQNWIGSLAEPYIKAGVVHRLDPWFQQYGWHKILLRDAIDYVSYNGHQYGVPVSLRLMPFWYNKTLFAKAGVTPPKTYAEFEAMNDRLVKHNIPPLAYGFLAPAIVIYVAFLVVPLLGTLWYSLTDWSGIGQPQFIGIRNYSAFFGDSTTVSALRNTVIWMVVMVTVPTLIGLLLANIPRSKGRWKGPAQAVFYLPAVLSMVGVDPVWEWLYNPQFGFINALLGAIGLGALAPDWLGSTTTAEPALLVAGIWVSIGFPMMLYLAGLQTIPPELYEAARVDGGRR